MSHLQLILDRLIAENLHEPITNTLPSLTTFASISPRSNQDDLDAEDSRWLSLFVEYFLENSDSKNDDLLFFVRQMHPENESLDPVFVKRKVAPNTMPPLDHPVLWKETFFLNLIVQSSMTCSKKHVSKRVYALPTKSRMDVKDSSMECSYPLIYYVIDDYEDMFENLIVSQDEYLCVERSMTNNLFPQQKDTKVILFQGAASYTSLLDVYQQKADGKLNRRFKIGPTTPPTEYVMMRGPHGKGESIAEQEQEMSEIANLPTNIYNNNHYTNNATSKSNSAYNNDGNNIHNNKSATISTPQRSNSTNSFFQSLKRLSQSITEKQTLSNTENLKCCMTFVNVPWASIIS
ncbi:9532_t:CDS:2 [Entrophospora sp. SA101]|nr:9532_t:CDS:2 [Entrophospora sp. SA101]